MSGDLGRKDGLVMIMRGCTGPDNLTCGRFSSCTQSVDNVIAQTGLSLALMQETLLIWRSWEKLGAFRRIRSDDDMMLNAAIGLPHAETLNALPA